MIYEYQWPQVMDGVGKATYPNLASSLPRMLEEWVLRFPNHVAIISGEKQYTYQDLWEHSARAASYLNQMGIHAGDRVVLRLPNAWSFVVWLFGSLRAEALVVPTNYRFSHAEFLSLSTLLAPSATICEKSDEHAARMPGRIVNEYAYMTVESTIFKESEESSDKAAILFLTSGTSGIPKAVPLSSENILTSVETYRRVFNLSAKDSTLIAVPLFHVTGLIGQLLAILAVGGTVVLAKRFAEQTLLNQMQTHRITFFFGVPTIFARLLNYMRMEGSAELPDWRVAASGGAPIPEALCVALKDAFPQLQIFNTYGMTEVSSPATILPETDTIRRLGSVGRPVPFAQLRVVDPNTGLDVPVGEVGELWIRGPMASKGYWRKSDRNECFTSGGWIISGDLARVDEGFVYIVGRLKDLINRGGEKIVPGEVESVLYQHPSVFEISVVGIPDEIWGEDVAAFVVLKPNWSVDAAELQLWVSNHISRHKVPRTWVIGSQIPKNANGKVDKRSVKKLILATIKAEEMYHSGNEGEENEGFGHS